MPPEQTAHLTTIAKGRAVVRHAMSTSRFTVRLLLKETAMSDDKTKSGGQDRTRISLSEDYEVRDWSEKFGVTPDELKAAVKEVGNDAAAVEAHLKGKR
jgi:hypothetical protein